MLILVLAVVIVIGFGVATFVKDAKETAYQDGVASAQKRQAKMEKEAEEASIQLPCYDQKLLFLILDIFAGRYDKKPPSAEVVYEGYGMMPALTEWLCGKIFKAISISELPENIRNNPWLLYEQYGPMPARPREFMEAAHERIEEVLQDSEEEAFRLLCEACQPYMDEEERKLKIRQSQVKQSATQICEILIETHHLTVDQVRLPQVQTIETKVPGNELQVFHRIRPRLGPFRYAPYETLRNAVK